MAKTKGFRKWESAEKVRVDRTINEASEAVARAKDVAAEAFRTFEDGNEAAEVGRLAIEAFKAIKEAKRKVDYHFAESKAREALTLSQKAFTHYAQVAARQKAHYEGEALRKAREETREPGDEDDEAQAG